MNVQLASRAHRHASSSITRQYVARACVGRRVCTKIHSPFDRLISNSKTGLSETILSGRSQCLRLFHTSPIRRREHRNEDHGDNHTHHPPPQPQKLTTRLAQTLPHENIYTLPNLLTFSRLLAGPAIGYLILSGSHGWAVALFFYAGATDLVDGWIARRWNQTTVVGTVVDPLADKALMTILTVCLAVQGSLPLWLATTILGRDISLAVAAIYYRFASLPPPKTLARYWDFSLPSAEVHPTAISKANTFLQLLLIGATTALPVAGPWLDSYLHTHGLADSVGGTAGMMAGAQYLVAATTVWSGASYLYTRNAVSILNGTAREKKRILVKGRMVLGASFLCCLGLALALES